MKFPKGRSRLKIVGRLLLSDSHWQRLRKTGIYVPDWVPARNRRRTWRGPSLSSLAIRYDTDKWGVHWYTPHYERHLRHLRRRRFTLLEIGIGGYAHSGRGGASLRMWAGYFKRATVVGLDIEDKSFVDRGRIQTVIGSQTDGQVLRKLVRDAGAPLVVIDDGSHRSEHVLETFRILFPLLPPGAIYVIEDTQTSYWPEWGGSVKLGDPATTMGWVRQLVDGLNHEEFLEEGVSSTPYDADIIGLHVYHNLVFIEKGANVEGSKKLVMNRMDKIASGVDAT